MMNLINSHPNNHTPWSLTGTNVRKMRAISPYSVPYAIKIITIQIETVTIKTVIRILTIKIVVIGVEPHCRALTVLTAFLSRHQLRL